MPTESYISGAERTVESVPAARILHTWWNHDSDRGVQLESLDDMTEIRVRTRNTVYELTLIDAASREVVIRGGRFFPQKTRAQVTGSSMGGGFLKLGGIYVGFCLEIVALNSTVITTRVREIEVRPKSMRCASPDR